MSSVVKGVYGSSGGSSLAPELLTNPEFSGAVTGTPGEVPTGWAFGSQGGSLIYDGGPKLTFAVTAGKHRITQTFEAVAGSTYELTFVAATIAGTSKVRDYAYVYNIAGTFTYYVDDVVAGSTSAFTSGTIRILWEASTTGTATLHLGAGALADATQTHEITSPSLKLAA